MEPTMPRPDPYRTSAPTMTGDAFVAWMETWDDTDRYELHRGMPVAMTGGTAGHDIVSMNLAFALRGRLAGLPCRLHRDLLVRSTVDDGFGVFPDLSVRCGPLNERQTFITDPTAVFEVISPSTEHVDRGYKLANYRLMPSIRHIGLIYPREVRVELWSRDADAPWPAEQAILSRLTDSMVLSAFDVAVPLAELYDGTEAGRLSA
jgi:Uma2 family endonuclease